MAERRIKKSVLKALMFAPLYSAVPVPLDAASRITKPQVSSVTRQKVL